MGRIPFMDPLVLEIAADRKTVTRRLTEPRFSVGDVVDVCEALTCVCPDRGTWIEPHYRCDGNVARRDGQPLAWPWRVRVLPARYCPAWAVRHRIRILDIRREPLSAITDADAAREGIAAMGVEPTAEGFVGVFRKMHGLTTDANVYRIEFKRVTEAGRAV